MAKARPARSREGCWGEPVAPERWQRRLGAGRPQAPAPACCVLRGRQSRSRDSCLCRQLPLSFVVRCWDFTTIKPKQFLKKLNFLSWCFPFLPPRHSSAPAPARCPVRAQTDTVPAPGRDHTILSVGARLESIVCAIFG